MIIESLKMPFLLGLIYEKALLNKQKSDYALLKFLHKVPHLSYVSKTTY
jgi:hypothetical protein